jgi:hypothetical protein
MTLNQMFALKVGDKIVKVRKHYQNYDHTKVPCEPKILTISWSNGSGMNFDETFSHIYWHSEMKSIVANASSWDNRQICEDFETLEDYSNGNWKQGIILDKSKYKDLSEFLEEKRKVDYTRAEEDYNRIEKDLKREHNC